VTTSYDDLPIEVRRENWGWFGRPWWSYICFDENGRLVEEMHKPFPTGEECLYCTELFDEEAGDSGQAMPLLTESGQSIRHVHKECLLHSAIGSVDCLLGSHLHDDGRTYRQQALDTWEWIKQHGMGGL
jgi:hypothetical protein